MIAFNDERIETTWQPNFIAMLPEIQQKLRLAFCHLDLEAREDAIEEGIVHSLLAYVRLHEQGRDEVATPSSLAWYSSRQVKRGGQAGGRMNLARDGSCYARLRYNLGPGVDVEIPAEWNMPGLSDRPKRNSGRKNTWRVFVNPHPSYQNGSSRQLKTRKPTPRKPGGGMRGMTKPTLT